MFTFHFIINKYYIKKDNLNFVFIECSENNCKSIANNITAIQLPNTQGGVFPAGSDLTDSGENIAINRKAPPVPNPKPQVSEMVNVSHIKEPKSW